MTTKEKNPRRPATQAGHLGRDPRKFLGAVNTPVFRASTMLFPTVADLEAAARGQHPGITYGLHGLPTVTDFQARSPSSKAASRRSRFLRDSPRRRSRCSRCCAPAITSSSPTRSTGRRAGSAICICRASASRSSYYDPLAGAAIEREFGQHELVFAESPGSLTFEVQDIPAIAAVAHAPRRARRARQYMGDAVRLPLVRSRRRRLRPRGDQIHRRPLRRAARADRRQRSAFPALHRLWTDMGVTASSDDCFLGLRGLRTLADAARPAPGERARDRGVARGPAGGEGGHLPGASRLARATSCGSAISRRRRGSSPWCCSPWRRPASTQCSTGCGCSHGLELGRIREPRHSDLSRARAHRDALGRGRAVPAARHRARGSGRSHRRSRGRIRAPHRLTSGAPAPRVTRCSRYAASSPR